MKKLLTPALCFIFSMTTLASEAELKIKLDLTSEIGALKIVPGKHLVSVSLTRVPADSISESTTVGMITVQIGGWKAWIPACLAKLIQSTDPSQMKVTLYNEPRAFKLKESMLDLDFYPPPNHENKIFIKYRLQMFPVSLASTFSINNGDLASAKNQVKISEMCHSSEIELMAPIEISSDAE